jgi:hypothetical protein
MKQLIKKNILKIDKDKDIIISELVEVLHNLGYNVRFDKGVFKGGFCLLREEKLFLINKNFEQDKKISLLAKNINDIGTEGIYLKPNIRDILERS